MREERDLDRLIDAALATYAEADSGLERRVLARIAARRAPASRMRRVAWAAALTAVACLLLLLVLMHTRPARTPETNARNTPLLEPAPLGEPPIASRPARSTNGLLRPMRRDNASPDHAAGKTAAAAMPRQEVFPTPRPLSPEERALVGFATHAPEAERESFVAAQKQAAEPITIAGIHIVPIQIPLLKSPSPGTN